MAWRLLFVSVNYTFQNINCLIVLSKALPMGLLTFECDRPNMNDQCWSTNCYLCDKDNRCFTQNATSRYPFKCENVNTISEENEIK